MNGQVGAVRNHVVKAVVVEHCLKQGIKTTMVGHVLVLMSVTKIVTLKVVQVSFNNFICTWGPRLARFHSAGSQISIMLRDNVFKTIFNIFSIQFVLYYQCTFYLEKMSF